MTASQRGETGTWRFLLFWEPDGSIDLAASRNWLPANDLHATQVITMAIWPGELHHASDLGRWHVWDGKCHRPDDSALIDRRINLFTGWYEIAISEIRGQVAAMVAASTQGQNQQAVTAAMKAAWEPWAECEKYAAGLRRTAGSTALKTRLAGACGVPESWLEDKHPEYLNCANGILHLPTLQLHPHDPRAGLTYCLDHEWNPAARCPKYWGLLLRACDGNEAVASYLVRMLGYCLLGGNPLQLVFFLKGETSTGKSQLLNVAVMVLGELAHESVTPLITVQRHGRNARVEYSIRGRRLITITETSGYLNLDEAQLKRLTGERVISVDRHYAKEQLRTKVVWTIIIATNEMPTTANPDKALQRRMVVVPMSMTEIPPGERITGYDELIAAEEGEGVLALLASACADVMAHGLRPPPEVLEATREYVQQQDTIRNFLAECCTMVSANGAGPAREPQHMTWIAYQWFCRNGPRLPKQEFKKRLGAYPGVWVNEAARAYEGFQIHPWVMEQAER